MELMHPQTCIVGPVRRLSAMHSVWIAVAATRAKFQATDQAALDLRLLAGTESPQGRCPHLVHIALPKRHHSDYGKAGLDSASTWNLLALCQCSLWWQG